MEELDMIKRAKLYMQSLAKGIDPISGEAVPKGETLLQPRLTRCFLYISEVLEAVEEDPSSLERISKIRSASLKPKKINSVPEQRPPETAASKAQIQSAVPLTVPIKEKQSLPIKGNSLSLNKITEALRPLLGENPKMQLESSEITEWLLLSGYLKHITRETDGAHRIIPTEKGEQLGILRVERTRSDGKIYHVNQYSPAAQEYIREHLNEILEQSSKRIFLKAPYLHPF